MFKEKFFSLATAIFLLTNFALAEDSKKARAGGGNYDQECSTTTGQECLFIKTGENPNINNVHIDDKKYLGYFPASSPKGQFYVFNTSNTSAAESKNVLIENSIFGQEGAKDAKGENFARFNIFYQNNSKANTEFNLKNVEATLENTKVYGMFKGAMIISTGDNSQMNIDGLKINLKNSTFDYITTDSPHKSAIYGAYIYSSNANTNLNIDAKNIELNLDNVQVTGSTKGIWLNNTKSDKLPGSIIGVLAGKKDEVKINETTIGEVNAQATVNITNGSNITGSVRGAEADSNGKSATADGTVNIQNSTVENGVIGGYAGNFQYSTTVINPTIVENIYNLRDENKEIDSTSILATAKGSVNLDKATAGNYLYGSAALNQKEAYSESNVTLQNNSKIAKDTYGSYAVSKNENATSIGGLSLASNSEIGGDAYGAYLSTKKEALATGNVFVSDSSILGNLYGTYIDDINKATSVDVNSTLHLIGNAHIEGNITANYLGSANGDVKTVANIYIDNASDRSDRDEKTYIYGNHIKEANHINAYAEIHVAEGKQNGKNKDIDSDIYGNYIEKANRDIKAESHIYLEGDGFKGDIVGTYIKGPFSGNLDLNNTFEIVNNTEASNIEFGSIKGHIIDNNTKMAFKDANSNYKISNTLTINNTQITVGTLENINDIIINLNEDKALNELFYPIPEYEGTHPSVITVTGDLIYDKASLGTATATIGGFDENQVSRGTLFDVLNVEGNIIKDGKDSTIADIFTNQKSGQIQIGFIHSAWTDWIIDPETGKLSVVITEEPAIGPPLIEFCKLFPDDESCICDDPANKDKPQCKPVEPPVDCKLNPDHPDCDEDGEIDCSDPENANDPQCKPIEPPVDCKLNPNHPACEFPVDPMLLARASSLYQARLANIATINKGADLLANTITLDLEPTKLGDLIPFASVEAGKSKYKTDGHFRNTTYNLIAGYGYSFDESVIGWFFEYGRGKYNATNDFSNGKVRGSGKAHYQGFGMLGKTYFGNFYLDGSIHSGINKLDYNTNDIVSGGGTKADFSNRQTYIASHAGAGYKAKAGSATFDTSAKVLYATIGKNKKEIANTEIKFDRINSTRLRIGEDYTQDLNKNVALKAGLAYEYELTAKAKGKISNADAIAPKLKGSTYEASLGLALHPFNGGDKNKAIELSGKGYLGKQKGGSGNLQFTYNF